MGSWLFSSFFFPPDFPLFFHPVACLIYTIACFEIFFLLIKTLVVARYGGHIESDLNSEVMKKGMDTKSLNKMQI